MAVEIGDILKERYRIVASLGRGGMADVYKVWDTQRSTHLALKLLRDDLAQDLVFIRRFKREAQNLAQLQHPNIVRFYGLEEDDLKAFILMEYVEGPTLREEIRRAGPGGLNLERIQKVMGDVCSALSYAHNKGLVHCDIKSGNVLIDKSGKAYLSDFGIARGVDAATSTMVGIGTPAYMAPELIKGLDPTPQTDIYALGILLYEMLTGGERPFTGERATITGTTAEKVRWEHLKLEPPPISIYNPTVTPEINEIIRIALAKKTDNRYQSIDQFIESFRLIENVEFTKTIVATKKDTELESRSVGSKSNRIGNQERKSPNIKKTQFRPKQSEEKPLSFIRKKRNLRFGVVLLSISMLSILIILNLGKLDLNNNKNVIGTPTIMPTQTSLPTQTSIPTSTPLPIGMKVMNPENIQGIEKLFDINLPGVKSITKSTFLENSNEIVSLGNENVIYFWDYRDGEIRAKIQTGLDGISDIDISEESDQLAIVTINGNLRIWQISSKELIFDTYFPEGEILTVSLNPNGKTAIIGTWRPNGIYSLDLENVDAGFELVATSRNEIISIEFSVDGKIFAAGTDYNLIKVFDSESYENIRILRGHNGWIRDIEFSPDGQYFASASADNTVKIWDIENGKLLKSLEGHGFWATRVDYAPNGELLLSTSDDGKVRVWDSVTGELLSIIWSQIELESGYLYSTDAVFSLDGKFLVVDISRDAVVEIWGLAH